MPKMVGTARYFVPSVGNKKQRYTNGPTASSVMGMLPSNVRLATPHPQTGRSLPDTG